VRYLLITLILLGALVESVRGDDNIYGPDGINLGPNGNPEQQFQKIEQQRNQIEQQKRQQQQAVDEYAFGSGMTLRQQYNGHYFVNGAVNDIPLAFAIDTGASFVTLPKQVASQAGIKCENEAVMETANGKAHACTGIISKLRFGDFSIKDVRCVIAPNLNHALMGNNVLERFKIVQHNGKMRITK